MVAGIIIGPTALALFNVDEWGNSLILLEQTARLTLAIGLMGVALRLPKNFLVRYWRPIVVLLGAVMALMWIISGLLTYTILGFSFLAILCTSALYELTLASVRDYSEYV